MAALSEVFAQFAQPGTTVTYLLPSGSKAQAQVLSLPSGNCKFSLQYAQDPASVKVSPHVMIRCLASCTSDASMTGWMN